MNRVEMSGRLIRNIEFSQTTYGTTMAKFTLVVDSSPRYNKEKDAHVASPNFVSVQAFAWTAESLKAERIPKGAVLYVDGEIDQSEWEDQSGKKQSKTRVKCNSYRVWEMPRGAVPDSVSPDETPFHPPPAHTPPDEAPF